MLKYCILCFVFLYATVCSSHDENYFRTHPKALQEAVERCPASSPKQIDCTRLQNIAEQMNEYIYELRMSPQGFGRSILVLQQTIAEQERLVKDTPALRKELIKNKRELKTRLSIVNWLEAPES